MTVSNTMTGDKLNLTDWRCVSCKQNGPKTKPFGIPEVSFTVEKSSGGLA